VSGGDHPYHIHVNPFQVEGDKIDPNGPDDPSNWRFWDTILIPSGAGGAGQVCMQLGCGRSTRG
jgi:FtsP/CotA-like multicopper oxidase with cupredoxin domain